MTTTSFNPKLATKFIVHGFIQHGQKKWMMDMKDAFLRGEDLNVICVDWNKGAVFPYAQASSNTQIAGAEIAKLIRSLVETRGASIADFHIIGHSLGAHVAGYAGERLPNLTRITGKYFNICFLCCLIKLMPVGIFWLKVLIPQVPSLNSQTSEFDWILPMPNLWMWFILMEPQYCR